MRARGGLRDFAVELTQPASFSESWPWWGLYAHIKVFAAAGTGCASLAALRKAWGLLSSPLKLYIKLARNSHEGPEKSILHLIRKGLE